MNKKGLLALFSGFLLVLCLGTMAFAAPGEAVFCKGLDENWKPLGAGKEFDTNVVSTLFVSVKQFKAMEVVVSLYQNTGKAQELIHRETVTINPEWNGLFLPDIPLPSVGNYTFTLTTLAGEFLSSGDVSIKEKIVEKEIPQQNKFEGFNLEGIFNKFKPINQ